MTESMLEKCAREVMKRHFPNDDWNDVSELGREMLLGDVRAVLLALREPDAKMIEVAGTIRSHFDYYDGEDHSVEFTAEQVQDLWPALIDSILSHPNPSS